jgi:archaellum component FlaC
MVDHIYGKVQLQLDPERPHVFLKELQLYVQHLKTELEKSIPEKTAKFDSYVERFKNNLKDGIKYYQELTDYLAFDTEDFLAKFRSQLQDINDEINGLVPRLSP